MTETAPPRRVRGPLRTWYDMHEALAHEVRALADLADGLARTDLDGFARRFGAFDAELRNHSEVEDGIMFPRSSRRAARSRTTSSTSTATSSCASTPSVPP